MGYIISGIKTVSEVKVGDTHNAGGPALQTSHSRIRGSKTMVFAGLYPVDTDGYEDLRTALEKLQLNDASLTFEPESSLALGFGFRCGFLGFAHGNRAGKTFP